MTNLSSPAPAAPARDRISRQLLPDGVEPDPRFTLANERTFLAWIRTSLGFVAAGVGLDVFAAEAFSQPVHTAVTTLLLVLGTLMSLGAVRRWLLVERRMRTGSALHLPLLAPLLGIAGAVVGAALAVVVLAQ
ncbi:YidH family protein [Rhodococcus tukisamuensis]|uniref:Putative membrane protein n=1 Tax=Rhodococcus tukisamuensis TaxID=168276 RepID=A0A1G7ELN1_9NOCA|nr:DUF202 domain-containing protein [Rhodococcus tukisamuensis]SDE64522.1 putative membrane protein [Rhodococcus tukisamuensis]